MTSDEPTKVNPSDRHDNEEIPGADATPADSAFGRKVAEAQEEVDAIAEETRDAGLSDEPIDGPKPAGKA